MRLNADSTLDSGFNATIGGIALGIGIANNVGAVVVQPDGKILIVGEFTMVNGVERNGIARLNADGSLDTGFVAAISGGSRGSIVLLADGRMLITGPFALGPFPVFGARITRLHADGMLDTSFTPAIVFGGDSVFVGAVVVQPDQKILISGNFSHVNDFFFSPYVARLMDDGTVDEDFTSPGFGGIPFQTFVRAVRLQQDGKIIVVGSFVDVGGAPHGGIARLNATGTLDGEFNNSGLNLLGSVSSFAVQSDNKIVLVGEFSHVNGEAHRGMPD